MDIEKLIEQLNGYFEGEKLRRGAALDAATALSTLRAENASLRKERDAAVEGVDVDEVFTIETPLARHRFCPSCGAPMTDEAVEMVMERLEALNDAGNQ